MIPIAETPLGLSSPPRPGAGEVRPLADGLFAALFATEGEAGNAEQPEPDARVEASWFALPVAGLSMPLIAQMPVTVTDSGPAIVAETLGARGEPLVAALPVPQGAVAGPAPAAVPAAVDNGPALRGDPAGLQPPPMMVDAVPGLDNAVPADDPAGPSGVAPQNQGPVALRHSPPVAIGTGDAAGDAAAVPAPAPQIVPSGAQTLFEARLRPNPDIRIDTAAQPEVPLPTGAETSEVAVADAAPAEGGMPVPSGLIAPPQAVPDALPARHVLGQVHAAVIAEMQRDGAVPSPDQPAPTGAGDGTFELRLDPVELGKVAISLRQEGDSLVVHVAADRPETLDLLRRNADQLLQEFRNSGFRDAQMAFGTPGQGGQQGEGRAPAIPAVEPGEQPPPGVFSPLAHPGGAGIARESGLDLRL